MDNVLLTLPCFPKLAIAKRIFSIPQECPVEEAQRVAFVLKQCIVKAAKGILEPIPVEVDVKIVPS